MDITLTFKGGKTVQVQAGTLIQNILPYFDVDKGKILAVRVDNEICSLSQTIETNAELEPVLSGTTDGASIYRRTLCFVLDVAAHKLFPSSRLLVGHSLGYGYYYTFADRDSISKDDIEKLQHEMEEIITADCIINQVKVSYKDAVSILEKQEMPETRRLLDYQAKPIIRLNSLNGFYDIYVAPLLHSTGLLKVFDLMPYENGFLLRFPASFNPDSLPEFQDNKKLFNIYKRYKEWGKRQNVTTVASLNDLVYRRKTKDFINISETFLNKNIADIADKIEQKGNVKVALLAGPSSSGKTTTSKKLAIQLKVLGYNPHVISLDNYYLGREKTPRDANGDYDYECLEALDVQQLNDNLVKLFKGETIQVPSYDFREGKQYFTGETLTMNEKDILIMEGIHGLNDKLTPLVPAENKFKVYLSALTQLNIDDHNRISTSDNRLIRRIVRDSQFRGKSAADTIKMWPSVQRGEKLHIFPFQQNADAVLNTAMDYELAVLKIYASPLLRCVTPCQREYSEASRLLNFLSNFYEIAPTYVPGQSIIREFIGGSEFKY